MKRKTAIVILIILTSLCGCSIKGTDEANINNTSKAAQGEMTKEYIDNIAEESDYCIELENGAEICLANYNGITCLADDNLVYFKYTDNGECIYYSYNIKTEETKRLGMVERYFMDANTNVYINNKIYLYITTYTDSDITSNLYCIDLSNETLEQVLDENLNLVLVYLKGNQDTIYSLKSYTVSNNLLQFVDSFDLNNRLSKAVTESNSDFILQFDVLETELWTFVSRTSDNNLQKYYICSYDTKEGNIIAEYSCEGIEKYIGEEGILKFKILGNYVYIQNLSRKSVLAELKDGNLNILFYGDIDTILDIIPDSNISDSKQLLFVYDTNRLLYINNNSQLYILELPPKEDFNKIKFAFDNGDEFVVALGNQTDDIRLYYYKIDVLFQTADTNQYVNDTSVYIGDI